MQSTEQVNQQDQDQQSQSENKITTEIQPQENILEEQEKETSKSKVVIIRLSQSSNSQYSNFEKEVSENHFSKAKVRKTPSKKSRPLFPPASKKRTVHQISRDEDEVVC